MEGVRVELLDLVQISAPPQGAWFECGFSYEIVVEPFQKSIDDWCVHKN